ncbi:hypothetical protein H0W26_05230 [Candidatus Dependentiae bacterium]|nr:hypothetical protein [Candidatus Dependentiae bacterium]
MIDLKKAFLVMTLVSPMIHAENLIKSVVINNNELKVLANDDFKSRFLKDDFFAIYEKDINLEKLDYSLVIMPFIMHVLSAVWISGETYYVDSMDRDLFYSIQKLKKVIKAMYPKTPWKGNLIPRKVVHNTQQFTHDESHMALLYSGGLDSTSSSFLHRDKKQLLITAWGQWDLPLNNPELWETMSKRFSSFAQQYGHTTSFIKSNYHDFIKNDVFHAMSPEILDWRMATIENIGWAGLTAPILFLKGYKVLRIASSDTWNYRYPFAGHPFIDNNISYAGIRLEHDMFNYTRLDKIEYIAHLKKEGIVENPWLYVCKNKLVATNCCNCTKCLITILGFLAVGENPAEYDFTLSPEVSIKNARHFLTEMIEKNFYSYGTMENFSHIQEKIKQRLARGEKIAHDFKWLLEIDFQSYITHTAEYKFQRKMQWKELHKLFPDISVPACYLA